jgi:general secretion pathway protein M
VNRLAAFVQTRWQSLSARGRLLLGFVWGGFGVWLFFSLAISPALQIRNSGANQRAAFTNQLEDMRALQQHAQELQKTKPLGRDESLKSLQSITPANNPALQMSTQGDRVLVQLKNLPASQLASWLAQARTSAQALPEEVHITRSLATGANNPAWDGQIILRLPVGLTP